MAKTNYRAQLTYDSERQVFMAKAPELEHCTGEGATRQEAVARLEEEIAAQLANMAAHGTTPPASVDEETYSGEFSVKVSQGFHRSLAYQARLEGVELSQLASELLIAALEQRSQRSSGAGLTRNGNRNQADGNRAWGNGGGNADGNRRSGGKGHSHMLDDLATFIEYVRGLDQGGGSGHQGQNFGGRGGGGGGEGGRRRRRGRGGSGGGGGGFRQQNGGNNGNGGGSWNAHGEPRGGQPREADGNSAGGASQAAPEVAGANDTE